MSQPLTCGATGRVGLGEGVGIDVDVASKMSPGETRFQAHYVTRHGKRS